MRPHTTPRAWSSTLSARPPETPALPTGLDRWQPSQRCAIRERRRGWWAREASSVPPNLRRSRARPASPCTTQAGSHPRTPPPLLKTAGSWRPSTGCLAAGSPTRRAPCRRRPCRSSPAPRTRSTPSSSRRRRARTRRRLTTRRRSPFRRLRCSPPLRPPSLTTCISRSRSPDPRSPCTPRRHPRSAARTALR